MIASTDPSKPATVMRYAATLTYDEPLLRKAAFAFWRRTVGIAFPIVLIALLLYVAYLAAAGDQSWVLGALLTVVAFGSVMCASVFLIHYRNGLAKLRAMGTPVAEFTAQDDLFTITSGIGSSSLKWSAVTDVWRFEGFWLLLFSKAQFSTLPLETMSPEMQCFVLERVRASGGKVGE